jgi:sarcosine oxidase gamma subunit
MPQALIQLDDLGALPKLGVKGYGAEEWLGKQGIVPPADILGAARFDAKGWIARLGAAEFFLESGGRNEAWVELEARLTPHPPNVYCIPRSEVTLVLAGADSRLVLAQTCGIDFRKPVLYRIVYSRIAGVGCGILPESTEDLRFRIWVDYTYYPYLWETLTEIVTELGGARPVQIECEAQVVSTKGQNARFEPA